MSGFLLDTNVVSEITKNNPNSMVVEFLAQQDDLWLASMVVHELEYGLSLLTPGRRKERLRADLSRYLSSYSDRILPVDEASAVWAAQFRVSSLRAGHTPDLIDMFIAGTAKAHDLTLVTRNVRDFDVLNIEILNPWNPQ